MVKPEIILSLGAEGGAITLYGVQLNQEWNFLLKFEHSPRLDDVSQSDKLSFNNTYKVGFHSAIELLDNYPWYMFIPRSIHPDFAEQFLSEVEKRISSEQFRLTYWRRLAARSLSLKETAF